SIADLLMVATGASLLLRRGAADGPRVRIGVLGPAVLAYVGAFLLGSVIGAARGGTWNAEVALTELKAPLQMSIAYLLAANAVRTRVQLTVFMWIFVLMSAVKGVQTILNAQAAADLPYALRPIIAHEDVVFMGAAIALAPVAVIVGYRA